MDQTWTWFTDKLAARGISLSEEQLNQFEAYYRLLVEWNEKMNLTGITEREAVYEKHFYDSISLAFYTNMNEAESIADIGSGAGFPSLPIKICFPHLKVTIVDSLNKRISFLRHVVQELGLTDVNCLHGRAEDVARLSEHRDRYDLVTARAVARLNVLNEFCLPFVVKGGIFAAMKGGDPTEELQEAAVSLRELKGKLLRVESMTLPFELSERHIVLIAKTDSTPRKYPRKAGTPLKQPIL
ncbi:16S rRNA (guanine(527)-N(7))-methyltransferase RsmG [Paenibacillus xylaniclasticus]|uniref:16S rRNA (guanine(527)-N(7))-methyltransferase RsmG n=1 Tax=Paenibacillus xylaniclasticus TaxID=588083 RepID=UPI000FD78A12|nr:MULTISPECIES: 16S rRNA (guanine(527)-N(7))-methyltransferase RsmG [Paenibacillus]GFN31298.1 ribosomal RNA small subunit methyltransferase G [Paenibacillus curdlanolyticus]